MSWNNGYETRRFSQRMKQQDQKYRQLGMTEEQIKAVHDFDLEVFLSDRRFAEHNQQLDLYIDDLDYESQCPLLKRFMDVLSVEMAMSQEERFWWVEEVEDEHLLKALHHMSELQKEILTLVAFDNLSQSEAGKALNRSQPSINRHLREIRKILLEYGFCPEGGSCDE